MNNIKIPLNIVVGLLILLTATACMKTHSLYPELDKGDILLEQQKQKELFDIENKKKEEARAKKLAELEMRLKENVGEKIKAGGLELCSKMKDVKGGCVYDYYLLERRKDLNASADGKSIYITEAMMNFTKTDVELAIVLGHEYAHNIMGHVKAKKTNAMIGKILGTMADIAAGTQGIQTGSAFSKAGGNTGAISFSKEFEKEADYIGLYITALAGYDITNAPEFWRRMSLKDEQSIYVGVTHPTTPERYLALEKTVAEITRKQRNGAILMPNFKD